LLEHQEAQAAQAAQSKAAQTGSGLQNPSLAMNLYQILNIRLKQELDTTLDEASILADTINQLFVYVKTANRQDLQAIAQALDAIQKLIMYDDD
jgi:hypothetical protein